MGKDQGEANKAKICLPELLISARRFVMHMLQGTLLKCIHSL